MKFLNVTPASLVVILSLILMISSTNIGVAARPGPNFGAHRRLLNLSGNSVELTQVPASLNIAAGNNLLYTFKGVGFQEYSFTGTWDLVNASATLTNFEGEEVGVHYYLPHKDASGGQPTWESFSPVSLVTGSAVATAMVSSNSIPWVLLQSTQNSGASNLFGAITYVQTLSTSGGLPPGSSFSAQVGDIYKSPYTASYFFYSKD